MDLNSQAASLLLSSSVTDSSLVESPDTDDDCESADEETINAVNLARLKRKGSSKQGAQGVSPGGESYHKMGKVQDRVYQTELLEIAKERNIIICLPTGSGKTYIALKLAEHMLPYAIEKRQKIVFLANNVPLVNQQARYFSENLVCTTLKDDRVVRALTGDLNVDIWKEDQWREVLGSCHIIVASTQIVLDAINKAYIKWNEIALLILDECHHAQKLHPMAVLMAKYGDRLASGALPGSGLPKVLGLTATIIKGQSSVIQIKQDIEDIEKLLCCKAVTHRNYEEVLKYSTRVTLKDRYYETNYTEDDPICSGINHLIAILDDIPKEFGSVEEISKIAKIDHPTLTSEAQIYNAEKGVPKILKSFIVDLRKTFVELGPFCAKMASTLKVVYLVKWIRELGGGDDDEFDDGSGDSNLVDGETSIRLLVELCKTTIYEFMHRLELAMNKAAQEGVKTAPNVSPEAWKLRNCVSDKIRILWELLEAKKPCQNGHLENDEDKDALCGLIFCERRITAQVLRWYLEESAKHWPDNLGFLKAEVMVGHSTSIGNTELARFTTKMQSGIVDKFHKKEINILVATQVVEEGLMMPIAHPGVIFARPNPPHPGKYYSRVCNWAVVEEGLNVPACNLVIRLDCITSYPSFVQSLGRARKQGAICYALINKTIQDKEQKKIVGFREYNCKLAETLEANALHVGELDEGDVAGGEAEINSKLIPPFNPSGDPNGPEVTATDAISLVHRYCNLLSCDKIAALLPTAWKVEKIDKEDKKKKYKAWVMLPIMSSVSEPVEGDWMPDKMTAKRSAFLNCCKLLYSKGELTKNLLPKPRGIEDFECEFLDTLKQQLDIEKKTASGKIGSRKRMQTYRKKSPEAFYSESSIEKMDGALPVWNYYKIGIKVSNFIGDDYSAPVYDFDKFGLYFGILTTQDLEGMPDIRLKANNGLFFASIQKCPMVSTALSFDQTEALKQFQIYMRDTVYNMRDSVAGLEMDPALLVAPFKRVVGSELHDIDWKLIDDLANLDEAETLFCAPADETRKMMKFHRENYENALLVPWYKEDVQETRELLVSISISDDSNAHSCFDDTSKAGTFQEYYQKRYGVANLYHPKFPLIVCKNIAKQLNFLTNKVDSYEMRKSMRQRNGLKVIPELVNVHVLPASLYVQGRFLPSILHRLSRLLIALELRMKVAEYHNWDLHRLVWFSESEVIGNNAMDCVAQTMEEKLRAAFVNSKSQGSSTSESIRKKERKSFVLMETLNPLTIDWATVNDCVTLESRSHSPRRGGRRDTAYAIPQPPTLCSSHCQNLISVDKVKSYHFDKSTNFDEEAGPSVLTVMEAFTLANAQDNVSLEKLEVIGDSVLKLIVSLHIFRSFQRWDEGKMTEMRMKLISNCHLYQLGKKHEIGEALSSSIFIPGKSWLPVGFTVPATIQRFVTEEYLDYNEIENIPKELLGDYGYLKSHAVEIRAAARDNLSKSLRPHTTLTHSTINDKNVADCMEAIIGAYYMNGGIDGAYRIMDYLGFRGPLADGSVEKLSRESSMNPIRNPHNIDPSKRQKFVPMLMDLEQVLGYTFKDQWLAVEALTHPTYLTNRQTPSYERLEYVGDAIIDFLVTNYILKETQLIDPGEITDLRAALVNNVTFGSLTVRYGFHKFLKYDSLQLMSFITQFERAQEEADHKVGNPFKLCSDHDCLVVREIEVPKVLGDVFESIIGAIYVDSGMSIDTVWGVLFRLMQNEFEQFSKEIPKSPLRELYELFPGKVKFMKPPRSKNAEIVEKYQSVLLKVPCSDTLIRGQGSTVKQAKQAAAKCSSHE